MSKINRTITLDYEINEKLKKENNASNLIDKLLNDYFKIKDTITLDDIKKRKQEIEESLNQSVNKANDELNKIESLEKEKTEEEKEEFARINKEKQKEQDFKDTFYNNFSFLVGKEPTKEEFEEFKKLWSKKESYNMYDFIYSKYPELNADIEEVLEDIKEDDEEKPKEDPKED